MTTPPTNPLQLAAAHLRAGKRAEARGILAQYVRQNPNSENGWLMLGLALDEPRQQIDCLHIVLRINPNNAEARERISRLTQPTAVLPPLTEPPPETPTETAPAPDSEPEPPAAAPTLSPSAPTLSPSAPTLSSSAPTVPLSAPTVPLSAPTLSSSAPPREMT